MSPARQARGHGTAVDAGIPALGPASKAAPRAGLSQPLCPSPTIWVVSGFAFPVRASAHVPVGVECSALLCPSATSQLQRAPRHKRCPARQFRGLVVRPWRRLFPAVMSVSVVLKPCCNVRALALLEGHWRQAGPDFAVWFIMLKFMAQLCPCHRASLFRESGVPWFLSCKPDLQGNVPNLAPRGAGGSRRGAPATFWGLCASGAAQTQGKAFLLFQVEVSTVFLASECGRPGRVLIPLVLQVLQYCRA